MLMQALRPWSNPEHEGFVQPGQKFEATEYRARELQRLGLAIPVMPDDKVIVEASLPKKRVAAVR